MHVQYLLSQNAYRLNHIFLIQPTNFANKFFFRPAVHRVYQFPINSKVSRWLSRGTRESLAKDFRGRVIQSLSRRAVRRGREQNGQRNPGIS